MKQTARDESRCEDSDLVTRIVNGTGREEAFARLVEKYWRFLMAWVRPRVRSGAEAEDVVQETFIRAFRAIDRIQDPHRFLGWLLKIARNQASDSARRRKPVQSLDRLMEDGELPGFMGGCVEDLAERIDRGDEQMTVREVVNRLPERYRLVILLRYFQGYTGSEIALLLGEPEGTIRNRLFRAIEKVRRAMPAKAGAAPRKRSGSD